ncbi:MAG TPA: hypothetical protein VFU73_07295 [Actinocrinis sp.]|nr:hypothetical protein [Actinocrinis sp.]
MTRRLVTEFAKRPAVAVRRDGLAGPAAEHPFEARYIGLVFGFVLLPLAFLGGTYHQPRPEASTGSRPSF